MWCSSERLVLFPQNYLPPFAEEIGSNFVGGNMAQAASLLCLLAALCTCRALEGKLSYIVHTISAPACNAAKYDATNKLQNALCVLGVVLCV